MTTITEALREYEWVARSRMPCEPAGTGPNGTCTTCKGTGEALRYPGLMREPCWCPVALHQVVASEDDSGWDYNDPDWQQADYGEDGRSSCECDGTGRVVVWDFESVRDALRELPNVPPDYLQAHTMILLRRLVEQRTRTPAMGRLILDVILEDMVRALVAVTPGGPE